MHRKKDVTSEAVLALARSGNELLSEMREAEFLSPPTGLEDVGPGQSQDESMMERVIAEMERCLEGRIEICLERLSLGDGEKDGGDGRSWW